MLLLFRDGKANRSGDECHRKDSVLQSPRGGAGQAMHTATQERTSVGYKADRAGENVHKGLSCGFRGKEQEDRVSRLRTGQLEWFWLALGHGGRPGCLAPALGD